LVNSQTNARSRSKMGNSSARPRKITIDNTSGPSVIQVSECVVERLTGNQEEMVRQARQQQKGVVDSTTASMDNPNYPHGYDPFLHQPSLTSIQIRQGMNKALKENDKYWDRRMEDLQKRHQEIQAMMEKEFVKALETYGDKKSKLESTSRSHSNTDNCFANRKTIIECYKKHPNEPMRCAQEVAKFAECVEQRRAEMFGNNTCVMVDQGPQPQKAQ